MDPLSLLPFQTIRPQGSKIRLDEEEAIKSVFSMSPNMGAQRRSGQRLETGRPGHDKPKPGVGGAMGEIKKKIILQNHFYR
jgi:hypothetical protein